MARSGLSELIQDVRLLCELGTSDYEVAGKTYWLDNDIQEELDRHRMTIRQELLHSESEYTTGTAEYYDYYWRKPHVERYGTANPEIFHLEDTGGTVVGTADYEINYEARHIRFNDDREGSAYWLTYRSYDINRVAARIWRKKAAHVAQRFDISSDNHRINASQLRKQYLAMAESFEMESEPKLTRVVRSDLNA